MRIILLATALLMLSVIRCSAQAYTFSGRVVDEEGEPVSYVTIALLNCADSTQLSNGMTDEEGKYSISCDSAQVIGCFSYIGMTTRYRLLMSSEQYTTMLRADTQELEEVVVEGDRTYRVKRTATGEIYYLSKYAKNIGDPFRALQEIPVLQVNALLREVSAVDNRSVLILIDGKSVHSGIAPIDPKEIESVEVTNTVSARYAQEGMPGHILNIRLKKRRKPYGYLDLSTRNNIDSSNAEVSFETGNPTLSLFGSLFGIYQHHGEGMFTSWQKGEGYFKQTEGNSHTTADSERGSLLLKWNLNDRDYLALFGSAWLSDSENHNHGTGLLRQGDDNHFTLSSLNGNRFHVLSSALYYRHDFNADQMIESRLFYKYNGDRTFGDWEEDYADIRLNSIYDYTYKNSRQSVKMDMVYSSAWNQVNRFEIGNTISVDNEGIEQVSEHLPLFRHRRWTEYFHSTFTSRWKSLNYMLSVGLNAVWMRAGQAEKRFFTPVLSVSGSYSFDGRHSVSASYMQTNIFPEVGQLNPYNTSSDPLVKVQGNQNLSPSRNHSLTGGYVFHYKNLYVSLNCSYKYVSDIVEPYGYMSNGVFFRSYRNTGRYGEMEYQANANYSFSNGRGKIYANVEHIVCHFDGLSSKHANAIRVGCMFYLKKWELGGMLSYSASQYTPISAIKYTRPTVSMLQVSYFPSEHWTFAIHIPTVLGGRTTETTTESTSYSSYVWNTMLRTTCTPWLTIRYTFRKNPMRKIRLGNVLQSTEDRIIL